MIKIGKKYLFNYPDFGTPDIYPDYTAHNGQIVKVMSEVKVDEEFSENRLYAIRAADGWTGQAWGEELMNSP